MVSVAWWESYVWGRIQENGRATHESWAQKKREHRESPKNQRGIRVIAIVGNEKNASVKEGVRRGEAVFQ